ncbi:hypothetical protein DPEC_G00153740 [Dallia pectoralis]|uniref:Uncharacterized protein n=1 Tax=Dallia pectoralis TaxID=75939 RepID=A0ACC2GK79_DALPE|nr:hypothetical protein DPEC_G00153740 [Dallia pectoralis]
MDQRFNKDHNGPFRMRVYERENFGGQMHELSDDCESIQERYRMSDCQSCNVTKAEGHWLMHEQPHFRGKQVYVRPGEYKNLREMGNSSMNRFMSMRRITDPCDGQSN